MGKLEGLPLSGPPHVVAVYGLWYSEHPYTHEDGTAKLASDEQQPYLTPPKSWFVVHMRRYIVRHVTYCFSVPRPWLFNLDPMRTLTCNTLYTYIYTEFTSAPSECNHL